MYSNGDDPDGRPAQQKFLDLSLLKPQTKDEVQASIRKLPEMKLRPEKIPDEEDVVKANSWSGGSPYLNPVPDGMQEVDIVELSKVDINWKMLTLNRPETALEVDIFTRIVYLTKITLQCIEREKVHQERAQSIRLKLKGVKVAEVHCPEGYNYDFYSRNYGAADRGQTVEEVPKPTSEPKPPDPTQETELPTDDKVCDIQKTKKPLKKKKRRKKKKKGKLKKKKKKKNAVTNKKIGKVTNRIKVSNKRMQTPKTQVQLLKKRVTRKKQKEEKP